MMETNGTVLFETAANGKLNGVNGSHLSGENGDVIVNSDSNNNHHQEMNGQQASAGKLAATNGTSARGLYRLDDRAWSRAYCVLGAQWGDEGKGKIVDLLASDMDVVCRCAVSDDKSTCII